MSNEKHPNHVRKAGTSAVRRAVGAFFLVTFLAPAEPGLAGTQGTPPPAPGVTAPSPGNRARALARCDQRRIECVNRCDQRTLGQIKNLCGRQCESMHADCAARAAAVP